ncbi:MAG: hypothetical protein KC425_06595, partial [Anaerolineales bacterium]|nr:hypothetical protein [Anaerolineales bacterium]
MTELDELVTAVLASSKYRDLAPELVRRIGARELAARRSFKEAVKATKNKLHQVGGAYFETRIDYGRAAARLRQAAGDEAAWRAACRELMRLHASTRERLPILDGFYGALLADVPPARSVLDIACGLNPLTWPWLPAAPGAVYQACDI